MDSPLGLIQLSGTQYGLQSVLFNNRFYASEVVLDEPHDLPDTLRFARQQLQEYFSGKRIFFDLPLDMQGTDFQKLVWLELIKIPYGKTLSYSELSVKLGDIKAVRAVAGANGRNLLNIVVPCHRVIGANGSLTGYGGELWRKKQLLELENNTNQIRFDF